MELIAIRCAELTVTVRLAQEVSWKDQDLASGSIPPPYWVPRLHGNIGYVYY